MYLQVQLSEEKCCICIWKLKCQKNDKNNVFKNKKSPRKVLILVWDGKAHH